MCVPGVEPVLRLAKERNLNTNSNQNNQSKAVYSPNFSINLANATPLKAPLWLTLVLPHDSSVLRMVTSPLRSCTLWRAADVHLFLRSLPVFSTLRFPLDNLARFCCRFWVSPAKHFWVRGTCVHCPQVALCDFLKPRCCFRAYVHP